MSSIFFSKELLAALFHFTCFDHTKGNGRNLRSEGHIHCWCYPRKFRGNTLGEILTQKIWIFLHIMKLIKVNTWSQDCYSSEIIPIPSFYFLRQSHFHKVIFLTSNLPTSPPFFFFLLAINIQNLSIQSMLFPRHQNTDYNLKILRYLSLFNID